jgi:hypothetical protein
MRQKSVPEKGGLSEERDRKNGDAPAIQVHDPSGLLPFAPQSPQAATTPYAARSARSRSTTAVLHTKA